jgi:hypothetical protein
MENLKKNLWKHSQTESEKQKCPAGTRQTEGKNPGLVWRNRKKINQIFNDYLYLPFFLLIILWLSQTNLAVTCSTEFTHFLYTGSLKYTNRFYDFIFEMNKSRLFMLTVDKYTKAKREANFKGRLCLPTWSRYKSWVAQCQREPEAHASTPLPGFLYVKMLCTKTTLRIVFG